MLLLFLWRRNHVVPEESQRHTESHKESTLIESTSLASVESPASRLPASPVNRLRPDLAKHIGVRVRNVMLEENVEPDVIANTVGFVIRSILKEPVKTVKTEIKTDIKTINEIAVPEKTEPKDKRKRRIVLDEIVGEVDKKEASVADNPRLKAMLEAREKLEDVLRARGALDPKE